MAYSPYLPVDLLKLLVIRIVKKQFVETDKNTLLATPKACFICMDKPTGFINILANFGKFSVKTIICLKSGSV
jgi:hypothetical protein